ncbi:MAG: hypothetical protein AAGJ18_29050 [Bacteroidota bacterium]
MSLKKLHLFLLFLLVIGTTAIPAQAMDNDSTKVKRTEKATIFKTIQSEAVPTITIRTAIDSILESKLTNDVFPASITFQMKNGQSIEKSVELKPRGKSRRRLCEFPPLQIRFSKEELAERGIRTNHKKLKLVTHCLESQTATPSVLKEYLAYKIYQVLSPFSLDAQLLATKYEDTDSGNILEKYAILLEDIDELAEEIGGKEIDTYSRPEGKLHDQHEHIFSLFQYMIGNTDWSLQMARNLKYIRLVDNEELVVVPYDFDFSGFVSTPYAKPNVNFGLQSVKQRVFMGSFPNKKIRRQTIEHFQKNRERIYRLLDDFNEMDELTKFEVQAYLDSFYKTIDTPKLVERALPIKKASPELSDLEGEMHF